MMTDLHNDDIQLLVGIFLLLVLLNYSFQRGHLA